MLDNYLLAKESIAGESRVRLMSRSEFVLTLQRDSQSNVGLLKTFQRRVSAL